MQDAPQPILSAPGDLKVDDCKDQSTLPAKMDERATLSALDEDTEIIVCLRSKLKKWFGWNSIRESYAVKPK
jgi:hypothetical protein